MELAHRSDPLNTTGVRGFRKIIGKPAFAIPMRIERLSFDEWERLRTIRLRSLLDSPDSFETTHEQASLFPQESWIKQLHTLPTFVAVLDGEDVGIVRGGNDEENSDIGWLISLWVAPEARSLGIGKELSRKVVNWAESERKRSLLLEVREGNEFARNLYDRMGFHPNGGVPSDCCEIQLELVL